MLTFYFYYSTKILRIEELWLYFSSHIFLCIFFCFHLMAVRFFKYKIDWRNRTTKNYLNAEEARTVSNVLKTVYDFNKQVETRFYAYWNYICKKYII